MFVAVIFIAAFSLALANSPTYPSSPGTSYNSYPTYNAASVPQNEKPSNASFPDDGCGDYAVRFKDDGYCYPVLKKGPCKSLLYWVTVDPYTYEGKCTPRLCGRERVFVGRDGLCHDIYDTYECQGGRRLYYSAYGDPICDCPIGQYPFPSDKDDCVPLFTQGPCPHDKVVTVSSSGKLECGSNTCPSLDRYYQDFLLQLVPAKESRIIGSDDDDDGFCYALGTRGPCSPSELFGYNIFQAEGQCLDMEDPTTPYFSSPVENALLDELYNHTSEEPVKKSVTFFRSQQLSRNRRQASFGIVQQSSTFPTSMLNPCQLGNRNGNNFKCTNPLVPSRPTRDVHRPSRPGFGCRPNDFLQANGQCGSDRGPASCGPSYQFDRATNSCRPRF
ncbi:Uncharacterized protein APZ42_027258 [Daphnia magna]|uniref:Uncharacterized protein n=2 Tax=Daphnia magna TaxID=35525 RepID=A0A0N8AIP1_9CRUS|nr:hypothetical protein OUZ56_000545 [Daphnia magna]KZS08610.1 Uncharacterized protein APZ42_027258 [Daphnia magna]